MILKSVYVMYTVVTLITLNKHCRSTELYVSRTDLRIITIINN